MGSYLHHREMNRFARAASTLTKAATASLTVKECLGNDLVLGNHATVAIALTLPPASAALKGVRLSIAQLGAAAVTVFVLAGFAGGGASYDTITLALGNAADFLCDGTYWYALNALVAAGS